MDYIKNTFMVLSKAYFGMGQIYWKQPTEVWWHKVELTFAIDCGMLYPILGAKILLYVSLEIN